MPRSGPNGTYTLPGAQATQQPGTPIPSAVNNQGWSDAEQTFNTIQPVSYGGTGVADGKPLDNVFGVKNSTDLTKIGVFNAANLPTSTTRTYDLPYYSGTLGLVSDIRGQIYGLTLSNNVTDATNDIDIAAGSAVDSTGAVSMLLASGLIKRLDAVWAVGTGNGGRMSADAIADTTYHVFLIRRPDTGVVDVGLDVSPNAPTLPTNYTQFRRIGSIVRSSGVILAFIQDGDHFQWSAPANDVAVASPGTAAVTRTLTLPTGIRVRALIGVSTRGANGATDGAITVLISDLSLPDVAPNSGLPINFNSSAYVAVSNQTQIGSTVEVMTNVSAQVRSRLGNSVAGTTLYMNTLAWKDDRGRNA